MGFQLEDGKGRGFKSEVDAKQRHQVKAITLPEFHDASDDGNSYSWTSGTYNYTGVDTILLVKNTSDTLDLHIEGIWLSVDTDTIAAIHLVTADVTLSGTTITGTNLNTGSANVAPAEAARDEVNNTQGSLIWDAEIYAVNGPVYIPLEGAVRLTKNKSIGVDYVTTGGACGVTILGFFD